jgi:hypothetical protein
MHRHAQNAEYQVEMMATYCLHMQLISLMFYWAFHFRASGLVRWMKYSWTKHHCSNPSVTTELLWLSVFNIHCDVF